MNSGTLQDGVVAELALYSGDTPTPTPPPPHSLPQPAIKLALVRAFRRELSVFVWWQTWFIKTDDEDTCYGVSWYLADDMTFFYM